MDDPAEAQLAHAAELYRTGRLADAEAIYRQILSDAPTHHAANANLASVLHAQGRYEAAVAALTAAIQREPGRIETQRNLVACLADWGLHLQRQGRRAEAIALYRRALLLFGGHAAMHNNLGAALLEQGDVAAATESFRTAIALDPARAEHHFNLGNALRRAAALDDAIASYRAALARDPAHVDATINLGSALLDQGARDDALTLYRRAVELAPDLPSAHSNLVLASAYDPTRSAAALRDLASAAGAALRRRVAAAPARVHDLDPARRLRVGLISADFRFHPVGWFIQAPLAHHDRGALELVCYADQATADPLTEALRRHADRWRPIHGLSDDAVAEQIAADRIDILIDLAGHSANNRLPALARRLAPLQASWIGFPMTTGLETIDYLIADDRLAPPGSDPEFAERVVRLPDVAWCYSAPNFSPPVAPPPVATTGAITFGSFNNPVKLNDAVLADWAHILARVPDARLVLKFRHLDGGDAAARLRAAATAAGIAPARLDLLGASPHPEALAAYGQVDIALDPFPFNGGTTTCEALWMGVPVVTHAGATMAGRMGASLITAAGLPELVAPDRAAAIEIAVALAGDRARLSALRDSLRARVAASPLCDGPRFARHFEQALRTIWRHHSAG